MEEACKGDRDAIAEAIKVANNIHPWIGEKYKRHWWTHEGRGRSQALQANRRGTQICALKIKRSK